MFKIWSSAWHNAPILVAFEWASILGLLALGCPSHVTGFVIAVRVDAINRKTRRTFTHIREEVDKAVPAFTDFNTARSVVFIILSIGIIAPSQHSNPDTIKRTLVISSTVSMTIVAMAIVFVASAGFDYAEAKMARRYNVSITAVTLANPKSAASITINMSDCD